MGIEAIAFVGMGPFAQSLDINPASKRAQQETWPTLTGRTVSQSQSTGAAMRRSKHASSSSASWLT
eukprot:3152800-Prymnesium_polylepis.1